MAARDDRGYGSFQLDGRRQRASRVAYILTNGPIGDDVLVLHRCDNPPCCRPEHLFDGDNQANTDDMVLKLRGLHGERHPLSKLTADDVVDIRYQYALGGTSTRKLTFEYGVTRSTVTRILKRENWRHI